MGPLAGRDALPKSARPPYINSIPLDISTNGKKLIDLKTFFYIHCAVFLITTLHCTFSARNVDECVDTTRHRGVSSVACLFKRAS
jgi:hypothetical protein